MTDDDKLSLGVFDPMVVRGVVEPILENKLAEEYASEREEGKFDFIMERAYKSIWGFQDMYNIYFNPDKKGCFVSIKIPHRNTETGYALHAPTRYMIDPKNDISFTVYPRKKEGRGNFWSKSIHRTKAKDDRTTWKKRISEYVDDGMELCITAYGFGSKDVPTLIYDKVGKMWKEKNFSEKELNEIATNTMSSLAEIKSYYEDPWSEDIPLQIKQEAINVKGYKGIPLLFKKVTTGIQNGPYCNIPGSEFFDRLTTEEKKEGREENPCKRIEALRADRPKEKVWGYLRDVNYYMDLTPNDFEDPADYDDMVGGEIFILPEGSCDAEIDTRTSYAMQKRAPLRDCAITDGKKPQHL